MKLLWQLFFLKICLIENLALLIVLVAKFGLFLFFCNWQQVLSSCLIFTYIWLHWRKPGSLKKPVLHIISSVEENLFIFGLVCYFCPGSQKINMLTAQYKQISNKQGVVGKMRSARTHSPLIHASVKRHNNLCLQLWLTKPVKFLSWIKISWEFPNLTWNCLFQNWLIYIRPFETISVVSRHMQFVSNLAYKKGVSQKLEILGKIQLHR